MSYIADLKIKVDSAEVETATDKLREFVRVSEEAGKLPPPVSPKPPPPPKLPPPPPPPKPPKETDPAKSAAQEQARSDKVAYQAWLQQADLRAKREQQDAANRLAIIANESKVRTTALQGIENDAKAAAKAEKDSLTLAHTEALRLDKERTTALKDAATKKAKEEKDALTSLHSEALRLDQERTAGLQKVSDAAKKTAKEEKDALNAAHAEALRLDKDRTKSIADAAKKKADLEKAQLNGIHAEALKIDKDRTKSIADNAKKSANTEKAQLNSIHAEALRIDKARTQSIADSVKKRADVEKAQLNALHSEALRLDKERTASILREAKAQKSGVASLSGEFDPSSSELKRLDNKQAFLKQNQNSFTAAEYDRINKSIDAAREKVNRYGGVLGRTSLSAKQLQMAQAGLPAQFTDIFVSLQGGQAPLTVLLQQGGQIKDMFGGTGAAIRGVGSAIGSVINPLSVSAAAFATLILLWNDGANQLKKLNGAIIQTGGYSGQTADQLRQLAEAHGQGISSVRENIEALGLLTKAGKLVPETFGAVSEAATSMANVSGAKIEDLVADFNTLGEEPVEAALKLNEKYHFLTDSIYQQAQALVTQGKESEATALLTNHLADTIATRAKDMEESGRGVAKVWNEVKNVVSNAITAAGKGLNPTDQSELEGVQNRLQLFRDNFESRPQMYKNDPEYLMLLRQELELKERIEIKNKQAKLVRAEELKTEATISARAASLKKEEAGWDAVRKAKEELKKFDQKLNLTGNKLSKGDQDLLRQPFLDSIKKAEEAKKKQDESKNPKSAVIDNTDVNELKNKVAEIKSLYKSLNETIIQEQGAGAISSEVAVGKRKTLLDEESAKIRDAYQQQISALEALKGSKNISANQLISIDRQIADARSKMVIAQQDAEKDLTKLAGDEERRLEKQRRAIAAYSDSVDQMVKNLETAGERERAALGMSSGEADLQNKLNSEADRYNQESRTLALQIGEEGRDQAEVQANMRKAAEGHTAMKKQIVSNYQQMKIAQQDWGAGISSAFQEYIEAGENFAGITNEVVTNAFSSMEDSIVNFVETGKASFSDFTKSVLADMARMAVRIAASRALTAVLASFAGPSAAPAASMNSASGWSDGIMAAKGAAFKGGTQFFAKGGAFTNSVVSKPTAFSTSGSNNNVMGEAGPEAIMPLTRASDGSLGVRAQVDLSGLQQNAGSGVQVYISIDGEGNKQTSANDPGYSSFGNEIGQFVDQRYKQLIGKDLQPGGDIWKSMQG